MKSQLGMCQPLFFKTEVLEPIVSANSCFSFLIHILLFVGKPINLSMEIILQLILQYVK